jgi:Domain of unknown function (DUF397)
VGERMNVIWVKSSLSFSNGNCVEVARLPGDEIGVRNSRDPDGPVLTFTPGEWGAFVGRARLGEFGRSSRPPTGSPAAGRGRSA